MKARTDQRNILADVTYVVVELTRDGQKVDYHFLPPSALRISELMAELDNEALGTIALLGGHLEGQSEELTLPGMALVINKSPSLLKAMGGLLGISWHNKGWDLSAQKMPRQSWQAYGAVVYEELHAGGFNLDQITMTSLALSAHVYQEQQLSEKTMERVRFFGKAPRVKSGADSSGSDNDTTGTSMPGMA